MENHKIGMDTIKNHESQKKDVKSYGLSASLMTGIWCFDGSVGIVFDHKGNIALQNTKGVGIGSGTPSISGGFFKSQYWTDDFKKLEGGGAAIGGSGSLGLLDLGIDMNFSLDIGENGELDNPHFIGYTVSGGGALNSTVVGGGEFHMNAGVTETFWEWNFYDWYDKNIYEKIMAW